MITVHRVSMQMVQVKCLLLTAEIRKTEGGDIPAEIA